MATQTLWPNVGVSELAEDGVTPITTSGIVVTLVQDTPVSALKLPDYYAVRVARSRLLTYDPLSLSGDPVAVPAVTRVSSALTGPVTADLAALAGAGVGELLLTDGDTAQADGGGDTFNWLGASGSADGYRVKAGVGGNWRRAIDRGRLNLVKFGARPIAGLSTPDCKLAFEDAIAFASADYGTSGDATTKKVSLLLPQGKYRVSGPPAIPGTNHHPVLISGEEDDEPYTSFTGSAYGEPVWLDPDSISGTVIMADPGQDCFKLQAVNGVAGSLYHRLSLRNLALMASGVGMGINMAIPTGAPGDWQAGRVQLQHVIIAGAKVGWQIASYELANSFDVRIYGCETGLRAGASGVSPAGAYIQNIWGCDLQGCTTAFECLKANAMLIHGANWQGCGTLIKLPAGANGRQIVLSDIRCETYQKFFDCDPAVADMGLVLNRFSLSSGAGLSASTVKLYGNGYVFNQLDLTGVDFELEGGKYVVFRDCAPRSVVAIGGTGNLKAWPVDYPTQWETQKSVTVSAALFPSGFTLDGPTHGKNVELNITGDVQLNAPTNYPPGTAIDVELLQGGEGGYAVTFAGSWHQEGRYSAIGNAAGNRAYAQIKMQEGGLARMNVFSAYAAP